MRPSVLGDTSRLTLRVLHFTPTATGSKVSSQMGTLQVAPPVGTPGGAATLAESQASYGMAESERRPIAQVQGPPVSQTIIEERR